MKMKYCKIGRRGTTLIEVLLYSLLVSGLLFVVSYFAMDAIGNKSKNDAGAEVNDNAQIITEQITSTIRNAREIQFPANMGQSDSALIITSGDGHQKNYNLADGQLQVSDNGGVPIALTSANIVVSNLIFTNLTMPSTKGNIRIQMDMAFRNPSGAVEFTASIKIDTSATLRPNN